MSVQLQAQALSRKPYPSDVSDDEWAFVAPYLTLMRSDAPQRTHDLREVFNAARWLVKTGAQWRYMPNHFPPWPAVYQQMQRWIAAGVFEAMVHDLRALVRLAEGRPAEPSAVVLDGRLLQSTPESGHRASYDGHKRRKGSKVHAVTGGEVALAYVDQGYTGDAAAQAAAEQGIALEVVRLPEAKRGFVLLPRRWGVERSLAWLTRFRRLARDFERLPTTLASLHYLAFACLLLGKIAQLYASP